MWPASSLGALEGPLAGQQSSSGVDLWRSSKLAFKQINAEASPTAKGVQVQRLPLQEWQASYDDLVDQGLIALRKASGEMDYLVCR